MDMLSMSCIHYIVLSVASMACFYVNDYCFHCSFAFQLCCQYVYLGH
uniref:Uncharacterized protein n=1 Tax=Rhizophora mucronata TaxID=61149 RepID=A0A2P2ITL6_RHIMU